MNASDKAAAEAELRKRLLDECKEALSPDSCKRLSLLDTLDDNGKPIPDHHRSTFFLYTLYIFIPSLMSVYAAIALYPSCINYSTAGGNRVSLFWSLLSVWLFGLVLLWTRSFIFLPRMEFCSDLQRDNHKLLIWILYLCYASILFAYELYAYTLSGWFVGVAVILWFAFGGCYFTVFLERHIRPCPAYGTENKALDGNCGYGLSVAAGITHLALLVCCCVLNSELQGGWRTNRVLCTGDGECNCLAGT